MLDKRKLLEWLQKTMERDNEISLAVSNSYDKAKHEHYGYSSKAVMEEIERGTFDSIELRPSVQWFAEQMELKLRENDYKSGWSEEHQSWLLDELYRNAGKIREDRGIFRAVNTANFAMMIADNARKGFARSATESTEQHNEVEAV